MPIDFIISISHILLSRVRRARCENAATGEPRRRVAAYTSSTGVRVVLQPRTFDVDIIPECVCDAFHERFAFFRRNLPPCSFCARFKHAQLSRQIIVELPPLGLGLGHRPYLLFLLPLNFFIKRGSLKPNSTSVPRIRVCHLSRRCRVAGWQRAIIVNIGHFVNFESGTKEKNVPVVSLSKNSNAPETSSRMGASCRGCGEERESLPKGKRRGIERAENDESEDAAYRDDQPDALPQGSLQATAGRYGDRKWRESV